MESRFAFTCCSKWNHGNGGALTPSELNSAFLTTTQDDLIDAELNDITYTIAAKYAKNAHKAKLQKQSKATVHDQMGRI